MHDCISVDVRKEMHERRAGRGREGEHTYLLISWLKMGAQPNPSTGWDSNTLPVPKDTTGGREGEREGGRKGGRRRGLTY